MFRRGKEWGAVYMKKCFRKFVKKWKEKVPIQREGPGRETFETRRHLGKSPTGNRWHMQRGT